MKVTISYKDVEVREPIEKEVKLRLNKLGRILKNYDSDFIHLRGAFEILPRNTGFNFSLNLTIPTGLLHTKGKGPDPRLAVKEAFTELETQVKKHKSKVRREHLWKRKRRPASVSGR